MKKCSIFLSTLLFLTLAACASPSPAPTLPIPTDATVSASLPPEETQNATPAPSAPEPASSPTAAGSTASPLMLEAYRSALETIYNDHLYPNGDPVDVPPAALMENNHFAIFDVDGDGQDELIYENGDSTTAGMITTVFGSMPAADGVKLYTELSGFPGMAFYDNGAVIVYASHNHGLAGNAEFWPHAIYTYDPGQAGYVMAGYADAWDGETFPQDFDGNPFPADLDLDGDQVIYSLTFSGSELSETWMDGAGYQQWQNSYLDGASRLELPWQHMTLDNIRAVAP